MGTLLDLEDLTEGYPGARAELEALRRDAERYRWLRDTHPADEGLWVAMGKPYAPPGIACWRHADLDAAIDVEIAAAKAVGAA